VVWNILTLEIAPGLGSCNLRPHIVQAIVHGLLSRDPIISTGAETLTLVVRFLPAQIIQPVWEEEISFVGQAGGIPESLSEVRTDRHAYCHLINMGVSCLLVPNGSAVWVDLHVGIGKATNACHSAEILQKLGYSQIQIKVQASSTHLHAEKNDSPASA
jgi:hypothetical protein